MLADGSREDVTALTEFRINDDFVAESHPKANCMVYGPATSRSSCRIAAMSPPNSKAIEVAASRVQDGDLNYAFRIFGRPPCAAVRDCERSTDPALPQTLFIILGGGFKKGYVHGSTNAEGMAPDQDGCLPEDISATIISCLGLDPQQELITPSSRPIALFRDGQRVSKLLV